MKILNNMLTSLLGVSLLLGAASCDKNEIYLGGADTDILGSTDGNVVYVTDGGNLGETPLVDFSDSYVLQLYLCSSKSVSGTVSATFSYDASLLEAYNAGSGSDVALFPQGKVSLADGGKVSLSGDALKSAPLAVTFTSDSNLDPQTTYAVPLRVDVENGQLAGGAGSYVILVRDVTAFPGSEKYYDGKPGMKVIAVMEVNSDNPLQTMGFTLKRSGKQFFDMVVLFSANINFDRQTGRVYVSRNENVQALLDQREKYLKPLQDRGIKVVLGILGNHDISGVSTLNDAIARKFAQEVKNVCDAYELDGVFLDDEYSDYEGAASGAFPGFVRQSTEAASRLAYEIRKAQPSRLLISYRYQALFNGLAVDGMDCSRIWDYVVNDYWVTSNPVDTYAGLRQNQAGTGSWNCAEWSQCIPANSAWTDRFSLTGMRDSGYGAMMIFDFYCDPGKWMTPYIIKDMGKVAQDFWGDELEYDGSWYAKDY